MTNEQEVLELANKVGAYFVEDAYVDSDGAAKSELHEIHFREQELYEFSQSIRDQEAAKRAPLDEQLAMLVDISREVEGILASARSCYKEDSRHDIQWQQSVAAIEKAINEVLSATQPTADAFIARIKAEALPQWQPIETAPSGVPVLIFYVNTYGKSRVIKARHIARFTEEANYDSFEDGVDEYDEENDRYTYREGWWEIIDNWEDYGFVVVHEGTPTHWMPLPAVPTSAKERNE